MLLVLWQQIKTTCGISGSIFHSLDLLKTSHLTYSLHIANSCESWFLNLNINPKYTKGLLIIMSHHINKNYKNIFTKDTKGNQGCYNQRFNILDMVLSIFHRLDPFEYIGNTFFSPIILTACPKHKCLNVTHREPPYPLIMLNMIVCVFSFKGGIPFHGKQVNCDILKFYNLWTKELKFGRAWCVHMYLTNIKRLRRFSYQLHIFQLSFQFISSD